MNLPAWACMHATRGNLPPASSSAHAWPLHMPAARCVWHHGLAPQDRAGHMDSVRSALFNSVFGVVVSVDEAGTVCTWDMATGAREGRFTKAHRESRVTAAVFDTNERRLVTVANDGSVRMWNFNNGSLLRQYLHGGWGPCAGGLHAARAAAARRERDVAYLPLCASLMSRPDLPPPAVAPPRPQKGTQIRRSWRVSSTRPTSSAMSTLCFPRAGAARCMCGRLGTTRARW